MAAGVMYLMVLCSNCCCKAYVHFLRKLVSKYVIFLFDSDAKLNC